MYGSCRTWEHIYACVPFVTYVCMAVVAPGSCCCCCCILHITTYLVRVLTDGCCTDEGTPRPCAPSAWLNNEINVGWCCCTHLFGVETDAGTQNKRKNRQRSSLTQLGVWPLESVCRAPHSHRSSNEEQTSERSDDVPPLSCGRLCAGACEKIPRTFAHSVGYLLKLFLLPLCVWALSFVPRTPPTRNRFRPL